MKQFGFFHPFFMSFYSKALYRDVALNWKGACFGYLLVLLLFSWLALTVKTHLGLARFLREQAPAVVENIPLVKNVKGRFQADVPQPYVINDPQTGTPIVIIDTTGQYTAIEQTQANLLITDVSFISRDANGRIQAVPWSQFPDFSLDRATMQRWLEVIATWAATIMFLVALPFSFVYRMVQALIYAAIGMLFVSTLRGSLRYSAVLRLAVIAVTPAIILDTVFLLAGVDFRGWWLCCLCIALGYLYFGVKAAGGGSPPPPAPAPGTQASPSGFRPDDPTRISGAQ